MSLATAEQSNQEAAIEATVPLEPGEPRPLFSKRLTGFNAEVYQTWIERWALHSAQNYQIVSRARGIAMLRKSAKDIPCVVVGIGPSLDDNIDALKNAHTSSLIIATDAALRPLVRHGIHPDLVVNYDARDEQASMWESIDTSPYVLLANSVTSPKTIAAWKGSLMFFNMMQSDDEFCSNVLPAIYPHLGQLPNLGTVGNGAVFLAWQMGCSPIMLVGMDLCYGKVKTYAHTDDCEGIACGWRYRCRDWRLNPGDDAGMPDRWQEIENKTLYDNAHRLAGTEDETIKGKIYKTDQTLRFYRNSLVRNIGKFDIPVINCSGGVLENMVRSKTLDKALECREAMTDGQTAVRHLSKILIDPRRP